MAASNVPETLAGRLGRALDSQALRTLVADIDNRRWTGRPGYPTRCLLGAVLARYVYGLPNLRRTQTLIAENPALQAVIGGSPSLQAVYRFTWKLRRLGLLERTIEGLVEKVTGSQIGRHVAIDSTDLPAWACGHRTLHHNGAVRERYSDTDASWGHRSAVSTRKGGGFYGYKLHLAVCVETSVPLAWEVRPANEPDMRIAPILIERLAESGIRPETVIMDKGYDYWSVHEACLNNGSEPVISRRKNSGTPESPLPREVFKRLYRLRSKVEGEFGRLKTVNGLSALTSRGLDRVRLHADLCLLPRLALIQS